MPEYDWLMRSLFSWEIQKLLKSERTNLAKFATVCEVSYETARKWYNAESFPNTYSREIIEHKTGLDMRKYEDPQYFKSVIGLMEQGLHVADIV